MIEQFIVALLLASSVVESKIRFSPDRYRREGAPTLGQASPNPYVKKSASQDFLIIDCDTGADDAMAILLALSNEKLEGNYKVIGITTVNGNTALNNVVENTFKTLKVAGRLDIPVYKGANGSILMSPPSDNFFGMDGFGDFNFTDPPNPGDYLQKQHAVDGLIEMVNKYPNEVTILCLAPLTNIALAIRKDPDFIRKVKQILFLGGSFEGRGNVKPGIEFNAYVDPEAFWIVTDAIHCAYPDAKPLGILYWDVIELRTQISGDWRRDVLGKIDSPQINLLNQAERKTLNGPLWVSGDPQAAAVLLNPQLITQSSSQFVEISLSSGIGRSQTIADYRNVTKLPANAILIQNFDVENYKKFLIQNLSK